MDVITVPQASPRKQQRANATAFLKSLAPPQTTREIAAKIDELAKLRVLIKEAQAAEKLAAADVVKFLGVRGLKAAAGREAIACLEIRTNVEVPVRPFIDLVGGLDKAAPALRVSITEARKALDAHSLAAIATTTKTAALRIVVVRTGGAA